MKNIYQTVSTADYFTNLKKIIEKAQMADRLKKDGPFTLFGPYNGAFGTYTTYDPDDIAHEEEIITLDEVLKDESSAAETLNYLLVPGKFPLSELLKKDSLVALNGESIPIVATNGNVIVANSFILLYDIPCSNGIVHVADTVLKPTL